MEEDLDRSEYYAAAAAAPEFDAACILIQLSGDSCSGGREEESVGDTTASGGAAAVMSAGDRNMESDRLSAASSYAVADGCGEIEVYPLRRKRKFRSVSELYAMTKKKKSRNKISRYIFL